MSLSGSRVFLLLFEVPIENISLMSSGTVIKFINDLKKLQGIKEKIAACLLYISRLAVHSFIHVYARLHARALLTYKHIALE